MAPLEDYIRVAPRPSISVALEPAANALNTLILLAQADELSGLGEWVVRTAASLPAARRHLNRLICIGMFYALQPDRRWSSFPDYVDALAALPAEELRNRLLRGSANPHHEQAASERPDPVSILETSDTYLAFLRRHFPPEAIDVTIETETYQIIVDPARMQRMVVAHLREMWRLMAPEWEYVKPMLQESANAFQQHDFTKRSPFDVAQLICGQDLKPKWEHLVSEARDVIFVPSAHNGPYLHKLISDQYLWVTFGARLPQGVQPNASALSRSELQVRLGALNDDTRLQILWLLSQSDELCAQDVMNRLDLSQSAASRHLRQLSATGYLIERRRSGEKCYSLNRERIQDTFRALDHFLTPR
jgi:DNA-binding transcriptional ArsR family regulator